jgi:hypothetical protein
MEAEEIHHHHVVPRSRGGTKTVGLCLECHGKAHHRKKNMHASKLTKEAIQALKDAGKLHHRPPFGFTTDRQGGLKATAEAGSVLTAVLMRLDGQPLRVIAQELDLSINKAWRITNRWMDTPDELKALILSEDSNAQ